MTRPTEDILKDADEVAALDKSRSRTEWINPELIALIAELAAALREGEEENKKLDELNPVVIVAKNSDGSLYDVRQAEFNWQVNELRQEMVEIYEDIMTPDQKTEAGERFAKRDKPTPPKKEI